MWKTDILKKEEANNFSRTSFENVVIALAHIGEYVFIYRSFSQF